MPLAVLRSAPAGPWPRSDQPTSPVLPPDRPLTSLTTAEKPFHPKTRVAPQAIGSATVAGGAALPSAWLRPDSARAACVPNDNGPMASAARTSEPAESALVAVVASGAGSAAGGFGATVPCCEAPPPPPPPPPQAAAVTMSPNATMRSALAMPPFSLLPGPLPAGPDGIFGNLQSRGGAGGAGLRPRVIGTGPEGGAGSIPSWAAPRLKRPGAASKRSRQRSAQNQYCRPPKRAVAGASAVRTCMPQTGSMA